MSGYLGIVYGYFRLEFVRTVNRLERIFLYVGIRCDDEDEFADPMEDKEIRDSEEVGCVFMPIGAISAE